MDKYKITFQTWDKLADLYQDKFMDLDLYNDTYDTFCNLIENPNANVFEIGCGPGNITKYILSKHRDFKIEAIDVAPNMIKLAKENNPTANFNVMDCREIDKVGSKFDAIVCGFCLPYLAKEDALKLIKDAAFLLNRGGIFYFSVIEGDYDKSNYETSSDGQHSMFVYYHQANYLQQGLKENKLEVVNLIRKHYPKNDGATQTHLIFIAKKLV